MLKELEFFYDVVSVPCYLAWTQMDALARETGAQVRQVPVFCGGIFKATSNPGPLEIPAKREWYLRDLKMWADVYGVPLVISEHLPIKSLALMRGAIVAGERGELSHYLTAIYKAVYVVGRNLNDPSEVAAILAAADLKPNDYFSEIERDDIKSALRENTDFAIARGAFGVPTFLVGERLFFGQDRLDFIKQALSEP